MESALVPAAGYQFSGVRIRGFARHLGLSTLRTLGSIPVAAVDAWRILRSFKPQCVIGVGAYASGPVVAEAALKRIPTVAVEMDSHMGWTNRLLSHLVDKVCLSFPQPGHEGGKFVYTGRPLRPALLRATREEGLARFGLAGDRPVVLVFGGSLGAHSLNEAALAAFGCVFTPFEIIHVTGKQDYPHVSAVLKEGDTNPHYQAFPFLNDFPLALAAADAAVARAGGSVAEILAKGVPSLLVPYPDASGDHQTVNARVVAQAGAAVMLPDAEVDGPRLFQAVEGLLQPDTNKAMRQAAQALARRDAAVWIADLLVDLVAARGTTP
jgi:UDP-N-acetylglucosamine--N-acetylmuramyl-(pentapeptide) pyrophosphoryl-undecaprenol N-acetylglucosamine transferase